MKKTMTILIALVALVAAFSINVSSASAAQRFIPNGIDPHNKDHAWSQVKNYASYNDSYSDTIAKQAGASSYSPKDYKPIGYGPAPANTANSADAGDGTVIPGSGGAGVKSLKLVYKKTGRVIYIMVRCANIRLRNILNPPPIKIRKVAVLNIRKVVKVKMNVCVDGKITTQTFSLLIKGKVKTKVWGKVYGKAKIYIQQSVALYLKQVGTPSCQVPPPPVDACVNIEGNQNNIPNGMVLVAGNCVNVQQNCGSGSYWSDSFQACVVNICGNVVIVTGDNNDIDVGGNCNQNPPPPPTCEQSGTCPVAPFVSITSRIILNDVPEGKNSGPMPFTVNASHAGSVTVSPDLGSVSSCDSTTKQVSVVLTLQPGNNSLCVIYYAPGEAGVMQDTLHYEAIVTTSGGTAKAVKDDTFAIKHPTRAP